MRIEYLLTLDDYAEALKTVAQKPKRKGWRFALTGWLLFCAILSVMFMWFSVQSVPAVPIATSPGMPIVTEGNKNIWITLAPSLAMVGMVFASMLIGSIQNRRRARRAMANHSSFSQLPASKILGFCALLPLVLLALPWIRPIEFDWNPAPSLAEWVSVFPWLAFIFILPVVSPFINRSNAIKTFAQQRSARRLHRVDVDENHLTMEDGLNLVRINWSTLDRYQETENLLKLITEDERIWIIPKRALPDPVDLDHLFMLVQSKISRGTFLPRSGRFPVLPQPVLAIEPAEAEQMP